MYSTSTSSGRGIAAKGIGRNPSGTAVCSSPVRAQLRTLLGQTAVYGLGGGVGQAIGVLTLPVFARALNSAEYGALELYTVGIAVAIVFVVQNTEENRI